MKILIKIILNSVAAFVAAKLIPGVMIDSFSTALVVAVVFGFLNTFIRPIITLLTLPINMLTLGLFGLVINGFMVAITDFLVDGFYVATFLTGILFSVIIMLLNWGMQILFR